MPHIARFVLAGMLGIAEDKLRVVAPDVGGGFGAKLQVYAEEALVLALAKRLGRPVKWTETRSEHMTTSHHGRDQINYITLTAKRDGTVTGCRARIIADLGAYQQLLTPFIPTLGFPVMGGCYAIPAIDINITGVFTNKMCTDAIRGAGRPEATYWIELAMDKLARELDMDPLELRRKNFIAQGPVPVRDRARDRLRLGRLRGHARPAAREASTSTSSAASRPSLRAAGRATAASGSRPMSRSAASPRRARSAPRASACSAAFYESANVRVTPTGSAIVYTGISPHGQGLDTSFAQIAGDILGIDPENVEILHGDTDQGAWGWDTYGSRSLSVGGEALARAARKVQDKAKRICAALLEAAPEDIELVDGKYQVKGSPDKSMTMAEISGAAHIPPQELPTDIEPGLEESAFYDPENFVFPFGAHACVVDVDVETGKVKVVRYVSVDDCGPAINPMLIDGQIHGGITHAIGQALYEQVVYDADGQLVTGTFVDYALPDGGRAALVRDRPDRDALADQLARRQGRRRGRHDRRDPGRHRGGAGRAGAARRRGARHAAHADARVGRRSRQPRTAARARARREQGRELDEHGGGAAGVGPSQPGRRRCGVIPAEFDYEAPETLDEAVRMLHENGEDAKLLAGGHSLLPLMKLRLAAPSLLVDLRRVPGLHGIQRENGSWRIGAMTRHADLQDTPELGVARGRRPGSPTSRCATAGRSAARSRTATPPPTCPRVLLALEGEVSAQGPDGLRTIAAADLFQDFLTTALAHDEVITEVRLPATDGWGYGYEKFTRRAEDWAMVGVCALVKKAGDGSCEDVRIGLTHMGSTPLRATAAEEALRGKGARRRLDRRGRGAGRRGHGAAGRPERHPRLQASPGARAHAPGAEAAAAG